MIVTSMQLTLSSRRDIAVLQKESSALEGEEDVKRSCGRAARLQRGAIFARRSYKAGEQGMTIARGGSEFRMKLTGHKPRMAGQLDEFHQPVGREAREP